ncbi:MAG: hypothetical protein ACREUA_06440, partial [Burkholderiales bacterium]
TTLRVNDAALDIDDRKTRRRIDFTDLDLSTGRLAGGVPAPVDIAFRTKTTEPATDVALHLTGLLLLDPETGLYALRGMNIGLQGSALGLSGIDARLGGEFEARSERLHLAEARLVLRAKRGGEPLDMDIKVPRLEYKSDRVTSQRMELNASIGAAGEQLTARLTVPELEGNTESVKSAPVTLYVNGRLAESTLEGRVTGSLRGAMAARILEFPDMDGQLSIINPALPKGRVSATLAGGAHLDISQGVLRTRFDAHLDDSRITAAMTMTGFDKQAYAIDVDIDTLDLDRYRSPKTRGAHSDRPFDLSSLESLNATGSVRIGELKLAGVVAHGVVVSFDPRSGGAVAARPRHPAFDLR